MTDKEVGIGMTDREVRQQIIEILALLHRRRWTDSRLARELGVSTRTILRWRLGERAPLRPEEALRLLRILLEES